MANIVIILKSISVLAKKRAKVPAKYSRRITMFILSTPTFFLYTINRAGVDLFKKLCIALCILQYIYISALAVAINGSYPDWSVAECIRTRKVYITLSGIVGFLSIGVMVYAGFMLKVDLRCNWKWNLGQVSPTTVLFFNASTGVSSLMATFLHGVRRRGKPHCAVSMVLYLTLH
jgi:hypothetical protein